MKGIIDLRMDTPLAHLVPGSPFHPTKDPRPWIPITAAGPGEPEPVADIGKQVMSHTTGARDLIAAIGENRAPLCSGANARLTVEMITAVLASHVRRGEWVTLPLAIAGNPLAEWSWRDSGYTWEHALREISREEIESWHGRLGLLILLHHKMSKTDTSNRLRVMFVAAVVGGVGFGLCRLGTVGFVSAILVWVLAYRLYGKAEKLGGWNGWPRALAMIAGLLIGLVVSTAVIVAITR